jgi:two-component system, LytTR family, sensor histidine kinase AgrC
MLVPLLFSFITLFATCTIEYSTLTMRRRLSTHILVRALAYSLGAFLYLLLRRLGVRHQYVYYFISLVYLLACDYLFSETLSQKIFLFFTDWCFTTFVSALCNWATAWIALESLRVPLRGGLYLASYFVLLPLYFRHGRRYVREMLGLFEKARPIYAAFPFLAFVLFTVFFGPLNAAESLAQFLTMALFICFILFTYYLFIAHFHTVFSRLQAENNLMNAERQLVLQKKYYAEVEKNLRAQQERLHDTRHHLVALSAMAAAGKLEDLGQYLARLLEQSGRSGAARYCENEVANAVLGGYIAIAREKGIAVSAELDLPQELGIDEYELCTLFGNTLENAIEACQRIPPDSELHPGRYIKLKSRVENGRLVIRIENSFHADPSIEKDSFASSKGARGGIGLESVKAVLYLYQGSWSCRRQGSAFLFSAVLNLRPA